MSEKSKGLGFSGGSGTSTANQELVVGLSGNWTKAPEYYKFSFINDQDCTIKVNGNTIPLRAGQGFESTTEDVNIESFILVTASVTYNFVGAY